MRFAEMFQDRAAVPGTKFEVEGFPVVLKLGDSREQLRNSFVGSLTSAAPIYGTVVIPVGFLFAGAETHIVVRAVVGTDALETAVEPSISLSTDREGSLGGVFRLEMEATVAQFEFVDHTKPGGLGKKTIVIEGRCAKVRVVAEGGANCADYLLRINGDAAQLEQSGGPKLKLVQDVECGWIVFKIQDVA